MYQLSHIAILFSHLKWSVNLLTITVGVFMWLVPTACDDVCFNAHNCKYCQSMFALFIWYVMNEVILCPLHFSDFLLLIRYSLRVCFLLVSYRLT
jgi:hypothetical protein